VSHGSSEALSAGPATKADYNVAVGYLRAFARLLVFALHSFVAYYAGPHPLTPAVLRMSIPIDDPKHFAGARILVAFNEISLMSLLFFLSGLFLWPSLSKKGAGQFLRERVVRLGLPFVVCGGLVAAIAYYPAYLASTARPSLGDYFSTWLAPGRWMTGPGWFLLVLFIYDLSRWPFKPSRPAGDNGWPAWRAPLRPDRCASACC
jgi:hypothetical protein